MSSCRGNVHARQRRSARAVCFQSLVFVRRHVFSKRKVGPKVNRTGLSPFQLRVWENETGRQRSKRRCVRRLCFSIRLAPAFPPSSSRIARRFSGMTDLAQRHRRRCGAGTKPLLAGGGMKTHWAAIDPTRFRDTIRFQTGRATCRHAADLRHTAKASHCVGI
jgi:hypothetical protein